MFLPSVKSVTTYLELDQLSITGLNSTHTHMQTREKRDSNHLTIEMKCEELSVLLRRKLSTLLSAHIYTTNPTWGEIGRALQGNSPSGRGSVPETAVSVVAPLPENTRTSYFHPIICIPHIYTLLLTYPFCEYFRENKFKRYILKK